MMTCGRYGWSRVVDIDGTMWMTWLERRSRRKCWHPVGLAEVTWSLCLMTCGRLSCSGVVNASIDAAGMTWSTWDGGVWQE
ncbi:unnamed protein product [Gongylonema pulchrum]|uniref:SRCR domain-containing protein n=1 Tax=Gongylonema pulchrum TaxID=637853 RepID=A0A183DSJ3_9BILA|nr:unnamed protein product [Gongylonema pulchrum]